MAPRDTGYMMLWPAGPPRSVQAAALVRAGLDPDNTRGPVYCDAIKGKVTDPARLTERSAMLRAFQACDRLLIYSAGCLAISVADANAVVGVLVRERAIVAELQSGQQWDLSDPSQVLALLEAHRKQRHGRGIAVARARRAQLIEAGEIVPGPAIKATADQLEQAARLWLEPGGPSLREIAAGVGLGHTTLGRNLAAIYEVERGIAQERIRAGTWDIDEQVQTARRRAEAALNRRRTKSLSQQK